MADLSITSSAVVKGSGAETTTLDAGEAITAGQAVYRLSSDGKAYKADANASAATAAVLGIALNSAAANQPVSVQTSGPLTINSVGTLAESYILSATAGGIAPIGDLASGWTLVYLGWGNSATELQINIKNSTKTKA